tara:strand:- start:1277 stop:24160 length:22884 start_codon:yes stop_codon:yes gene_type:complete
MPPEGIISYEAMKIFGMSYQDAIKNKLQPTMMSYEESKKRNQKLIEDRGISEEEYAKIHLDILGQATNRAKDWYTAGQSDYNINPVTIAKANHAPSAESVMSPQFFGKSKDTPWRKFQTNVDELEQLSHSQLFDRFGGLYRTMTKEQEAEQRGYYYDENGKKKPLGEYQAINHLGEAFRTGEDGRKMMLVLSNNPSNPLESVYKEVPADEFHKGTITRSMYGPKEVRNSAFRHGYDMFMNTMLEQTAGSTYTIADVIGSVADYMRGDGTPGSLSKWAAEGQNWTNIRKSKIAEFNEKQGFWDDGWSGKMGVIGNAGANILGMMTLGRITGGAALYLGATAKVANMISRGASYSMGAGYGAYAMNEEAKNMGLSREARNILSVGAGAAVLMSETALSKLGFSGYVNRVLGNKTTQEQRDIAIRSALKESLEKAMPAINGAASKEAQKKVLIDTAEDAVKNSYKRLGILGTTFNAIKNATSGLVQAGRKRGGTAKFLANISEAAVEEGSEEVLEAYANYGLKWAHDNIFSKDGQSVGQGLFGAKAPTFHEIREAFTGGAVGGSFGGIIRSLGSYDQDAEISNNSASNVVSIHNSLEASKQYVNELGKNFSFGNPLLDKDGRLISALPAEEQAQVQSQNDIAKDAFMQQVELAWATKERLGLQGDANKIAELMGGDTALMQEAIKLAMDENYYGQVHEKLKGELSGHAEGTFEHKSIKKQLVDLEKVMADKSKKYNSIIDGTLYSQYLATMATNATLFDEKLETSKNKALLKARKNEKLNKKEKAELQEVFNTALNEASSAENFNNHKKSYIAVKTLKNIADLDIKNREAIQKAREDDKTVENKDVTNKLNDLISRSSESNSVEGYNEVLTALQEIENASLANEDSQLTKAQANKARKVLKDAQAFALNELDKIKLSFADITEDQLNSRLSEEDKADNYKKAKKNKTYTSKVKANRYYGANDYKSMNSLLGDQAIFSDKDLDGLMALKDRSRKTINHQKEKAVKKYLYLPTGKTILSPNAKGELQKTRTHLLDVKEIDTAEGENYTDEAFKGLLNETYFRHNGDISEIIDKKTYDAKSDEDGSKSEEDGWEYEKNEDSNTYVATNILDGDVRDPKDATPINAMVRGKVLTAEEHAFVQSLLMSPDGRSYDEILAGIDESLRQKKSLPTMDRLNEVKEISKQINDKLDAIKVIRNLKNLEDQGVQIKALAKKALGWDSWTSENIDNAINVGIEMLVNNNIQAFVLAHHISNNTNVREQALEAYKEEDEKIQARIHSMLSAELPNLDENGNSLASYQDKNGKIQYVERPDINEKSGGYTSKDLAKIKQYWHVYFNTKDGNGNYINIDTQSFKDFVANHFLAHQKNTQKVGSLTDTSQYTLENFEKAYDPTDKSSGYVHLKELILFNYIHSALNQDPHSFHHAFTTIIDKYSPDGKTFVENTDENGNIIYPGKHSPEQKNVIENTLSFLQGRKRALEDPKFKKAQDKLYELTIDHSEYGMSYEESVSKNIQAIIGNAGTGKTSYGTQTIVQIANELGILPKKILLLASNDDQLNNLKKGLISVGIDGDLITTAFAEEYLSENEGNNAKNQKDTLIIFDEYTLVTANAMKGVITDKHEKSLNPSSVMLMLGDPYQAPPSVKETGLKIQDYVLFLPTMTTVQRTGFADIGNLQSFFRAQAINHPNAEGISNYENSSFYEHDKKNDKYSGIRIMSDRGEFIDFAKKRVNNHGATLIVFDESQIGDAVKLGFDENNIKAIASEDKKFSPQGAEMDEVHVYIPMNDGEYVHNTYIETNDLTWFDFKKFLLTAVSRGKKFVSIHMDGIQSELSENIEKFELEDLVAKKKNQYDESKEILDGLLDDISSTKPEGSIIPIKQELPQVAEGKTKTKTKPDEDLDDDIDDELKEELKRLRETLGDTAEELWNELRDSKYKNRNQMYNAIKDYFLSNHGVLIKRLSYKNGVLSITVDDAGNNIKLKIVASITDDSFDFDYDSVLEALEIQLDIEEAKLKEDGLKENETQGGTPNQNGTQDQKEINHIVGRDENGNDYISTVTHEGNSVVKGNQYKFKNDFRKNVDVEVTNITHKGNGEYSVEYTIINSDNQIHVASLEEFVENSDPKYKPLADTEEDVVLNMTDTLNSKGLLSVVGHQPIAYTSFDIPNMQERYDEAIKENDIALAEEIAKDIEAVKQEYFKRIRTQNELLTAIKALKGNIDIEIAAENRNIRDYEGNLFTNQQTIVFRISKEAYEALQKDPKNSLPIYEDTADLIVGTYNTNVSKEGKNKDVAYIELMNSLYKGLQKHENKSIKIENVDLNIQPAYIRTPDKDKNEEPIVFSQFIEDAAQIGIEIVRDDVGNIKITQSTDEKTGITKSRIEFGRTTFDTKSEIVEGIRLDEMDDFDDYLTALSNAVQQNKKDTIKASELIDYLHFWETNRSTLIADYNKYKNDKDSYIGKLVGKGYLKPVYKKGTRDIKSIEFVKPWTEGTNSNTIAWAKNLQSTVDVKLGLRGILNEAYDALFEHIDQEKETALRYAYKAQEGKKEGATEQKVIEADPQYMQLPNAKILLSGTTNIKVDPDHIYNTIENESIDPKDQAADDLDNEIPFSKDSKNKKSDPALYNANEQEVQNEYRRIFGEEMFKSRGGFVFATNQVDFNGDQIHGWIRENGELGLNKLADGSINIEAMYHEMMHFIDFFLLDKKEKSLLYEEVKNKTGLEGKAAREHVADMAGSWMAKRKRLPGWSRRIVHFLDWVANLFRNAGQLLGFNNTMKTLFYETYYQERFNGSIAKSDTPVEFDLYKTYFSKNNRESFQNVTKVFPEGRPNVPIFYANKLMSYSAQKMLDPDILKIPNTISGEFDYEEIVSDLEYHYREKMILFAIKNELLLAGTEMPLFRFDTAVKNITNLSSLSDITGLEVLDLATKEYLPAPKDTMGRYFNNNKYERKANREMLFDQIGKHQIGEHQLKNSKFKEQFFNIGETQKKDYIYYHMLNDKFLFGVIHSEFPGLKLGDPSKKEGGLFYTEQGLYDENNINNNQEILDTVSKQESIQVNPMERQADTLKFIYSKIPSVEIYKAEIEKEDGTIDYELKETSRSDKYIDQQEMDTILTSLGSDLSPQNHFEHGKSDLFIMQQRIRTAIDPYINDKENFKSKTLKEKEAFETGHNKTMEHLLSLYNTYFDKSKLSHYSIIEIADQYNLGVLLSLTGKAANVKEGNALAAEALAKYNKLAKKSGKPLLSKQDFEANILKAARTSRSILAGLIGHYKNIQKNKLKKVEKRGEYTKVVNINSTTKDEYVNKLEAGLRNMLINDYGEIATTSESLFVDGINSRISAKTPSTIYFGNTGIYYNPDRISHKRIDTEADPRLIKVINFNENTGRPEGVINTDDDSGVDRRNIVNSFFKEMGLGEYVKKGAISKFTGLRYADDDIGWEDFENIYTDLLMSSYIYTHNTVNEGRDAEVKNKNQNTKRAELYSQILENKLNNPVYGKINKETLVNTGRDLNNRVNLEGDEQIKKEYSPTAFKKHIGTISNVLAHMHGGNAAQFYYDIEGKKIMLSSISSSHLKDFQNGSSLSLATDFQSKYVDNAGRKNYTGVLNHNVLNGKIVNPALRNTVTPFVYNMHYMEGVQKGNNRKLIAGMTERDNYETIYDIFVDEIKNNFGQAHSVLPMVNQVDRSRQFLYELDFRSPRFKVNNSNGLIVRKESELKGEKVYSYDYDSKTILLEHVNNSFQILEKAQINSLNRWINFFNVSNEKYGANYKFKHKELIPEFSGNVEGYRMHRKQINTIFKDLNEYLKTDAVIDSLTEDKFINFQDMRSSVDYVVLKSKKGKNKLKQKIALGWDTSMNSPIWFRGKSWSKAGPTKSINGDVYNTKFKIEEKGKGKNKKNVVSIVKNNKAGDNIYTLADLLLMINSDPNFLPDNLSDWYNQKMDSPEEFYKNIIEYIYKDQLDDSHTHIRDSEYELSADAYGTKSQDYVKPGIKNKEGKYDPIWVAMIVGHNIANDYIMHATQGTYATQTDSVLDTDNLLPAKFNINNNKRLGISTSPNFVPTFGEYDSLDEESKYLIIEDPKTIAQIKNAMAENLSEVELEYFDGQNFRNPMVSLMFYNSMGKYHSLMNKNGMSKTISHLLNKDTGQVIQVKSATENITAQTLEFMPVQNVFMEIFLNPEKKPTGSLYHIYQEALEETGNFESAIEITAEEYFKARLLEKEKGTPNPYTYISGFVMESSTKQQAKPRAIPINLPFGIQSDNANKALLVDELGTSHNDILSAYKNAKVVDGISVFDINKYSQTFIHKKEGVQLNANKAIDDNSEAPMQQLMSIILSSPSQDVESVNEALNLFSKLYDMGLQKFEQLLSKDKTLAEKLKYMNDKQFDSLLNKEFEGYEKETEAGKKELDDLNKLLKDLSNKGIKGAKDSSTLARLSENKKLKSVVDFPGAKTRVYQYVAAYMRNEVIKQKQAGLRVIQTSGKLIELVETIDPITGFKRIFSVQKAKEYALKKYGIELNDQDFISATNRKEADAIFSAAKADENAGPVFVRKPLDNFEILEQEDISSLNKAGQNKIKALAKKHAGQQLELDSLQEIGTPDALKKHKEILDKQSNDFYKLYRELGLTAVQKGQIIIPATFLTKFGLSPNVALSEVFSIWTQKEDGTFDENNLWFFDPEKDFQTIIDGPRNTIAKNLSAVAINNFKIQWVNKEGSKYQIPQVVERETANAQGVMYDLMLKTAQDKVRDFEKERLATLNFYIDNHAVPYNELSTEQKNEREKQIGEYKTALDELKQKYSSMPIDAAVEKATDAVIGISETLETISVRTPSGPGSGYYAEVVGWINDNGSNGYFNTMKNIIDGSDQDIDQITVYMKSLTDKLLGKSMAETSKDVSNEILDFVINYYKNPKNDIFTKARVNLDPIKKAAENAQSDLFKGQEHGNGLVHSIKNRISTQKGKVVGTPALGQKFVTFLFTATQQNNNTILNENILFDDALAGEENAFSLENSLTLEDFARVVVGLETQINAATDNPKLNALGVLNISIENANMVNAMFLASKDVVKYVEERGKEEITDKDKGLTNYEAIYKLLRSPAHKDVMKQVERASSISSKFQKQPLSAVIFKKIYNIEKNTGEYRSRINLYQENIDLKTSQLKDLLKNNFGDDFSEAHLNKLFSIDEETGNYNATLKSSDKIINRLYKIINLAKHEGFKKEIDEEENEKKVQVDLENKLNVESDSEEIIKNAKEILGLAYSISRNIRAKHRTEKLISSGYKSDLFQLAKYSMLGDWISKGVNIANLNQGTPIDPYKANELLDTVKHMTGQNLQDLLIMYESFKSSPIKSASEWLSKNGLDIKTIRDNGFDQYKHRMTSSRYDWMRYNIHNEKKFEDNNLLHSANVETINYYEMFHKLGDFTAALFSSPNVMGQLKALATQVYVDKKTNISAFPIIESKRKEFLHNAGMDKFSHVQWNTFHEEVDKFYIAKFFAERKTKKAYRGTLAKLKENGVTDIITNAGGDIILKADTSNAISSRLFILNFAEWFTNKIIPAYNLKNHENRNTQRLIDLLEIQYFNNVKYLGLRQNGINLSDSEIIKLQEGFANLPEEVRDIISYYQISKDKFKFSGTAFSKILDVEQHVLFSDFLDKIKKDDSILSKDTYSGELEVFINDLKSKPDLGLLQKARFLRDKSGKLVKKVIGYTDNGNPILERVIIPPPADYGFANYFYEPTYTKWTPHGYKEILMSAQKESQTGFTFGHRAGQGSINLSVDSTSNLSPHNIKNEDGISIAAMMADIAGYVNREKTYDAIRFLENQPEVSKTDENYDALLEEAIANIEYTPDKMNKFGEKYINKLDVFDFNARSKFLEIDEEGNEKYDFHEMRVELYDIYKHLYIQAIKNNPSLLTEIEQGSIFIDPTMKSENSAAVIVSRIGNEFLTHQKEITEDVKAYEILIKGKDPKVAVEEDAIRRLGTMDESLITPPMKYSYWRHRIGNFGTSYDPKVSHAIHMNHRSVEKEVVPFFKSLKENIKVSDVRIAMRDYAILLEQLKQKNSEQINISDKVTIEDLKSITGLNESIIKNNLEEIKKQLSNNKVWIENNVDNDMSIKHAIIIKDSFRKDEDIDFTGSDRTTTVKRLSPHNIEIGDKIVLSDGATGIITSLPKQGRIKTDEDKEDLNKHYKYLILPSESYKSMNKNVLASKISIGEQTQGYNSKVSLKKFVDILSRTIPNVEFKYIDQQQAEEMDQGELNSFVYNGVIYINTDKANRGIALHEFSHPISFFIEKTDKKLWDYLAKNLQGTAIESEVKRLYPEITDPRMLSHEVIATFLQKQYSNQKEQGWFKKIWNFIRNLITKAFGLSPYSAINNINLETADIQSIANAIIDDMVNGRHISDISTAELSELMPLEVFASKTASQTIYMSNIDEIHIAKNHGKNNTKLKNSLRAKILSAIDSNGYYTGPSGNVYNLKEDATLNNVFLYKKDGEFSHEKRAKRVEKILDFEVKGASTTKNNFRKFLKLISSKDVPTNLFVAAKETIKPGWKTRYKHEDAGKIAVEKGNLQDLLAKIGYNPRFDSVFSLSNNKDIKTLKSYGIELDSTLLGKGNPLVIFHNVPGKENSHVSPQISLIDVTNERLKDPIASISKDGTIFINNSKQGSSFLNRTELAKISLLNNRRDLNFTSQAIQAMAIRQKNPNIHIRNIGTVQIMGNSNMVYTRRMKDILPQVNILMGNKTVQSQLDNNIKLIVNDKTVNDPNNYRIKVIDIIKDYANTRLGVLSIENTNYQAKKSAKVYEDLLEKVNNYEAQRTGLNGKKLANLILNILQYKRATSTNVVKLDFDEEYQQLAEAYIRLTSIDRLSESTVQNLNTVEMWVQNTSRYDDDYRNSIKDQISIALRRSKDLFFEFQQENDAEIRKLQSKEPALSRGSDQAKKLFEPLFKKQKVPVLGIDGKFTGEQVEVSIHELYWDETDPETKQALEDGIITKNHLEYSKYLVDALEQEFLNYLIHKNKKEWLQDHRKDAPKVQEEILMNKAKAKLETIWKKGMLPAISRRATAALAQKDYKDAFQLYMQAIGRHEGAYDEHVELDRSDSNNERYTILPSFMWSQFETGAKYGSIKRLDNLGLVVEEKSGKLALQSKHHQDNISYNLQDIGNYSILSSVRSRSMDDVINAANVGIDLLRGMQAQSGIATEKHIHQLKILIDRNIYGELPTYGKQSIAGYEFSLDNAIYGVTTAVTNLTMGLAPALALKNFASSQIKTYANALANAWAGNEYFAPSDIRKAWAEFHSNSGKVSAINKKYKIVALSERDMMSHALYNRTKMQMTEGDVIMGGHFMGDYVTKLVAMTAQMMKDGTYDAHDNEGNYNPQKDKRFYTHIKTDRNGNIVEKVDFSEMSEDGRLLMEDIRDHLAVEELHDQHKDPEGQLKAAYFVKQSRKIQILVERLAADVTSTEDKNLMSAYGVTKLMFALKNYMFPALEEWTQKPHKEESIGRQKVITRDGKRVVVWEKELVEGILYTMLHGFKEIIKYNGNGKKVWEEMTDYQRRNLGKLVTFSLSMAALYGLVTAVFGGEDDERSSPEKWFAHVGRGALKEQLIQVNPGQLYLDWKRSPNMLMMQTENAAKAGVGLLLLPAAAWDEGIATALDDWAYLMSKNIIGGTGYRDVRKFFADWIDKMIENLDN